MAVYTKNCTLYRTKSYTKQHFGGWSRVKLCKSIQPRWKVNKCWMPLWKATFGLPRSTTAYIFIAKSPLTHSLTPLTNLLRPRPISLTQHSHTRRAAAKHKAHIIRKKKKNRICHGPCVWLDLAPWMKPIFIFIATVNLFTAASTISFCMVYTFIHNAHIPSLPIQSRQIKEAPPREAPTSPMPMLFDTVRCWFKAVL